MAKTRHALPAPAPQKDESEVRWLISYSDFMMQLVCLFILLYSVSSLDKGKMAVVAAYFRASIGPGEPPVREETPPGERLNVGDRSFLGGRTGQADLPRELDYKVEEIARGWKIEFSRPLFETGSSALSAEARAALGRVAARFHAYVGRVTVTGGAGGGADALGGEALSLAQSRAESVVEHLTRRGMENAFDPRFVVAEGRGAAPEGEARRVTIVIRAR